MQLLGEPWVALSASIVRLSIWADGNGGCRGSEWQQGNVAAFRQYCKGNREVLQKANALKSKRGPRLKAKQLQSKSKAIAKQLQSNCKRFAFHVLQKANRELEKQTQAARLASSESGAVCEPDLFKSKYTISPSSSSTS